MNTRLIIIILAAVIIVIGAAYYMTADGVQTPETPAATTSPDAQPAPSGQTN